MSSSVPLNLLIYCSTQLEYWFVSVLQIVEALVGTKCPMVINEICQTRRTHRTLNTNIDYLDH